MTLRQRIIVTLLVVAATAASVVLQTAFAEAIIWGACSLDCKRLGWTALAYGPALGYALAAVVVSVLGMTAFRIVRSTSPAHRAAMHDRLFAAGAAASLLLIAASPSMVDGFIPNLAMFVADRI